MNCATSRRTVAAASSGSHGLRRLPGAKQRAPSPRHQKQISSRRRLPAERLVAGLAPRDEVHRLQRRHACRRADRLEQACRPPAGRVHRDARGDCQIAAARCRPSVARTPVTRPPVDDRRGGLDVIGQRRSVLGRGEGQRERQAIGFRRDVVVPDGRAGQPLTPQSGKALRRRPRGRRHVRRQPQRRRHAAVAIERDESIEPETRPASAILPRISER